MNQVDAKHQHELGQIHQNYLVYLERASHVFKDVVTRLTDAPAQDLIDYLAPDVDEALALSHKIKGNGAMYGYAELGCKAERVEAMLADISDETIEDTLQAIRSLLTAIHDIIQDAPTKKSENISAYTTRDTENTNTVETRHFYPTLAVQNEAEGLSSQPAQTRLERKRLILAFQDVWTSNLLKSMFEPQYEVRECHNEVSLLTAVMQFSPDLLILEDELPRQGGVAWLQIPLFRDTPVHIVFNEADHEKIACAISAGVAGYSDTMSDVLQISQSVREMLEQPPKRVLIVDDDLAVREMLRHHLQSTGLRVDVVSDGIEALEYLSEKTPDLIILDRFMPRLEGSTVLYEIQNKANLRSTPVLILTAMVNRGEAKMWFERGAADFIPKPFDPEEVAMRVKQHLQSHGRQK